MPIASSRSVIAPPVASSRYALISLRPSPSINIAIAWRTAWIRPDCEFDPPAFFWERLISLSPSVSLRVCSIYKTVLSSICFLLFKIWKGEIVAYRQDPLAAEDVEELVLDLAGVDALLDASGEATSLGDQGPSLDD